MNEAAQHAPIELNNDFFGQLRESKPNSDPRVVRWGFNPGIRGLTINPRESGLRESFIPVFKFLAHTTFQTPEENCTLDEYKDKEIFVDVTAADVQASFERILGEWGYQSFMYGEMDVAKVTAMNRILLPTLQEIRDLFEESPIDLVCKGEDEMDIGEPRAHCATCLQKWIRSAACEALIVDAVENGRSVTVRTPEGVQTVTCTFSYGELKELREQVELGIGLYIRNASGKWSQTISELESGKRDQIQDAEHYLRKDLHAIKPQNKEVEMVERVTNATQQTAQGQNEILAALAASQIRTNELLAQIALQKSEPQIVYVPQQVPTTAENSTLEPEDYPDPNVVTTPAPAGAAGGSKSRRGANQNS